MRTAPYLLIVVLLASGATFASVRPTSAQLLGQGTPATSNAEARDVESIDAIMAALYEVVSGAADDQRDWDRMRTLFHPGAPLIPTGLGPDATRAAALVQSLDEYIATNEPFFEAQGFFEEELHREVFRYGHVAQVASSYAARRSPAGKVFMRGINFVHLLHDGTRWWILSLAWNPEHATEPLPAQWGAGRESQG